MAIESYFKPVIIDNKIIKKNKKGVVLKCI